MLGLNLGFKPTRKQYKLLLNKRSLPELGKLLFYYHLAMPLNDYNDIAVDKPLVGLVID